MSVICSLCRKAIPQKEIKAGKNKTYSACSECRDAFIKKNEDKNLTGVIDQFETPVLIVDEDCRIVASNKFASHITGPGPSKLDLVGLYGGEVMGCEYADLPEGCGKTSHCVKCAIRESVKASLNNGRPQKNVPVTIKRKKGDIKLILTTEKIFSLVRINIKTDVIPSSQ